jgi:transposase
MEPVSINKKYYCGIDLHANVMYACVMSKAGKIVFHHEMPTDFSCLLKHLKPYLSSIAVCAESTFNWYWLADGCAKHNIPFFLGHALYMKLIHGGKTKNDRIDAKIMADLLRNGFFPPAYPYPERMCATRDLLRRRAQRGHDHHALALLRTMKGLGTVISLTLLYEIHTIKRFKSAQCFSSYARVVRVERSSHGKKLASKNHKIGNPYLRNAFGMLATSAKRYYPAIDVYTKKLVKKYGNAKAYTLLAHKFAVAVYYMLKNKTAFDVKRFVAA